MKFGPVPLDQAQDCVLAHQVRARAHLLRKGHRLSAEDVAILAQAGFETVTVARFEPGDLSEDEAAFALAQHVAGAHLRIEPPFTGRANLFAQKSGLLEVDAAKINAFNQLDEAMTLATLPHLRRVETDEMVGTVKIIPFALSGSNVLAGQEALSAAMRIAPFSPKRIAVLSTRLPMLKESSIDKTLAVMAERVLPMGGEIVLDRRIAHDQATLVAAFADLNPDALDLIVIFGASAISDRRDLIPAAIEAAGGRIEHLGMPVDPGNLLLLAEWQGIPVIGAPGCARSKRENGFDWVLERLCADIRVTKTDLQAMGVGGLLMEIISRPQPRAGLIETGGAQPDRIAAIVLAAGRSTRFGAENKLLATLDGVPMLHQVVRIASEAGLSPLVVTGHQAADIAAQLADEPVQLVHNPDFAQGLSSSLRTGLAAVSEGAEAAFILLGDMPRVLPNTLRALQAALQADAQAQAFVPVFEGRWGNPVLVRRSLFASLSRLHGDQGARKLLQAAPEIVREVPVDDAGILADFDTKDALFAARRHPT